MLSTSINALPTLSLSQMPLVQIPGGNFKFSEEAGVDGATHSRAYAPTVSPFRVTELITKNQFEDYITKMSSNGLTQGRFVFGKDGHIKQALLANSKESAESIRFFDRNDEVSTVSGVYKFIPKLEEFRKRFVYDIKICSPKDLAVNIKWYEAALFCFMHGGRLPTEAERIAAALHRKINGRIVWEWCHDRYAQIVGDVMEKDPAGPAKGDKRIVFKDDQLTSSGRFFLYRESNADRPNVYIPFRGFRAAFPG